jgi:predicted NAD/FAD-dependent oxidoreductase
MRVGIIGAGLSGLAAARALVAAGHEVLVVEKSRGMGGRLAARRVEGTVVDHGAPVTDLPPQSALAALVSGFPSDDLVELYASGTGRQVAYRAGATRLAKLMAEGADIVLGVRIGALRAAGVGFELAGEQGNTHGVVDAVIVSAPAPQAADLIEQSSERGARVAALRRAAYEPAIMILAGFAIDEPDALDPFEVAVPFMRVTAESVKRRGATGGLVPIVARVEPGRSAEWLDVADADILADAVPALRSICGAGRDPAWVQVKRWRYATLPPRSTRWRSTRPAAGSSSAATPSPAPDWPTSTHRAWRPRPESSASSAGERRRIPLPTRLLP